jgi:hypothetical protein
MSFIYHESQELIQLRLFSQSKSPHLSSIHDMEKGKESPRFALIKRALHHFYKLKKIHPFVKQLRYLLIKFFLNFLFNFTSLQFGGGGVQFWWKLLSLR